MVDNLELERECREMAAEASSPVHRAQLLRMANTWAQLAVRAEQAMKPARLKLKFFLPPR